MGAASQKLGFTPLVCGQAAQQARSRVRACAADLARVRCGATSAHLKPSSSAGSRFFLGSCTYVSRCTGARTRSRGRGSDMVKGGAASRPEKK